MPKLLIFSLHQERDGWTLLQRCVFERMSPRSKICLGPASSALAEEGWVGSTVLVTALAPSVPSSLVFSGNYRVHKQAVRCTNGCVGAQSVPKPYQAAGMGRCGTVGDWQCGPEAWLGRAFTCHYCLGGTSLLSIPPVHCISLGHP